MPDQPMQMADPEERDGRATARRIPAWLALALGAGLIALVALTSRSGSSGASTSTIDLARPALTAIEVVGYVGLAVGLAALPLAIALSRGRARRERAGASATRKKALVPIPWWANLLAGVLFVSVVFVHGAVVISFLIELARQAADAAAGGQRSIIGDDGSLLNPPARDLTSLTIALVVVTGLVILSVVLAVRWRLEGRGNGDLRDGIDDATTVAAVETGLEAMRGEPDPRRAVIAAYASMERSLAGSGFGRRRSEAPLEFLRRVLAASTRAPDEVRTLTLLYQDARFSQHPIDEGMRARAIEALERIRTAAVRLA